MPNPTLKDWFFLKSNRDHFQPRIGKDRDLFLCHEKTLQEDILGSVEMKFAANQPVKMVLFGDWGVGKTHTVYHVSWWFEQHADACPAKTVMIEIGDIEKKSRFDVVVRPFLDTLGLDFLIQLAHAYSHQLPATKNVASALEEAGVSSYVASLIVKFNMTAPGMAPPPVVVEAFNILKGRSPSSGSANLGMGEQLSESTDFYSVLLAVGEMYRAIHKHRIIFIADEAAKLDDVTDDATEAHWIGTNRLIFDDKNDVFGFMYTLSAATEKKLPRALWEPQVKNRIGSHMIRLDNLADTDVASLVAKIRSTFVEKTSADSYFAANPDPAYNWDYYPFNKTALDEFVDYFRRSQQDAKPRDISERMNKVAFIALKEGKRVIDEACLRKGGM